jgi:hypothetical protein
VSLRLPARSVLDCKVDPDEIVVSETLAAKEGVIPVLILAIFMQVMTIGFSINGVRTPVATGYIIPLALVLVQIPLMLAIIHQTWRKTFLTVRYNQLLLSFTSPLRRLHYQWTGDQIADILFVATANTHTEMPLAELLITRGGGGDIRLFTDHRAEEIKSLVGLLPPMLREGLTPVESAEISSKVEPLDPSANAVNTSSRLLDLQRDLRKNTSPTSREN